MTRASMLAVLASDFVRTARASGLSPFTVIVTYAFRNAMLPVVTTLGMVFSFLLGANVLVEKVFAWPGIGSYAVEALIASDFAPVQGFVLDHGGHVRGAQPADRHSLRRDRSAREARGMTNIAPAESSAAAPDAAAQYAASAPLCGHARYVLGENPVTGFAFGAVPADRARGALRPLHRALRSARQRHRGGAARRRRPRTGSAPTSSAATSSAA